MCRTTRTSGQLSRDFSSLVTSANLTSHANMYFDTPIILGIFMGIPVSLSQYNIVRNNPLEKLSRSLVKIEVNACDGDSIEMKCTDGNKV